MSERSAADYMEWNRRVIEEFRANGGKVAQFSRGSLLLLTTTGAKSGRSYTNPLACMRDGDRLIVFASKAGVPSNPDWYYNLVANPDVTVEVGMEKFAAKAVVTAGEERDRLFGRQAAANPVFGQYQAKTRRTIPVIALVKAS